MNNGYTRIPHELMRNPNLPPIAKVVWSLIAGMRPGFNATLSQYCKMVACHPDTWRSTIKMLELFGMVSVERLPNGVRYSAITDTSKWSIPEKEGMKISHPMKISQGRKNSYREGMKISGGEGMKISHPSEEHITEEQKNNIDDDARTRVREEVMSDGMVEMGCMSLGIDRGTYENLAFQVFTDWDFQNLPDGEWTKTHFLAVMRYKVSDYKKSNNNGQRDKRGTETGNGTVHTVSGFKILNR
jgi:hypothetical protein